MSDVTDHVSHSSHPKIRLNFLENVRHPLHLIDLLHFLYNCHGLQSC